MHQIEPDPADERASALLHGAGVIASLLGGVLLIGAVLPSYDNLRIISAIVYSFSLLLLYSVSTIFHSVRSQRSRAWLEVFDHCAIFVLIAGTYTPFLLVTLSGGWRLGMFSLIWGLALMGIILKLFFTGRFQFLSTLIYIILGWLAVLAYEPLTSALPLSTVLLLLAGGITYTAGTYFFHSRQIPFSHAIWHIFVLGGSIFHFLAVLSELTAGQTLSYLP
jgi:hemolysin III